MYVTIISGPAMEMYKEEANPYTFRPPKSIEEESVFLLPDTLSSRAGINDLSSKFKDEVVAIIGLGGTGSYILDFLAKTPVKEIRLFDNDKYHVHNTFRSPGRLIVKEELDKSKMYVYKSRYETFRKNIIGYEKLVDVSCRQDIEDVTFAFVCVDKGEARANIISLLASMGIPFIDTGIGINRTDTSKLRGQVRTTYFSTESEQIEKNRAQVSRVDGADDMYKTDIQIGEINALNACLAVIRYKQIRGFYSEADDDLINSNLLFDIANVRIYGDVIENN
jgi:molybdopterin/thiamine biosynthesis adenylyltransferase